MFSVYIIWKHSHGYEVLSAQKAIYKKIFHIHMSDEIGEIPEFGKELKEKQHLFTILGIFGAISIYLSNFSSGDLIDNQSGVVSMGIASSLLLFLLISLYLVTSMYKNVGRRIKKGPWDTEAIFSSLFMFIFSFLISAVIVLIGRMSETIVSIFSISVFSLGGLAYLLFEQTVKSRYLEDANQRDKMTAAVTLICALLVSVLTTGSFILTIGNPFHFISGKYFIRLDIVSATFLLLVMFLTGSVIGAIISGFFTIIGLGQKIWEGWLKDVKLPKSE